jgi:hypothetical protein
MPRKRSQKAIEYEVKLAKAIEEIQSGKLKSAYAAEKAHGISRNAIMSRMNGGASRAIGNEGRQLLSTSEEDALFLWCKRLTVGGFPAHHQLVKEMAQEILTRRVAQINTDGMVLVNVPTVGKD